MMRKIRLIMVVAAVSLAMMGTAQVTKNSEMPQKAKLWLNNGKTVRGTVTEFVTGESVTLADGDSVRTTYAWDDIKKIKRVRGYGFNSFTGKFEHYASWQRGFHGIVDVSFFAHHLYFLSLTGGYQALPWLYCGVGARFGNVIKPFVGDEGVDRKMWGVFGDVAVSFMQHERFTPMLDVRVGKLFGKGEHDPGIFIEPSFKARISFKRSSRLGLLLGLGYMFCNLPQYKNVSFGYRDKNGMVYYNDETIYWTNKMIRAVNFSLGLCW